MRKVRRNAARSVPRVRVVGVCQPAPGVTRLGEELTAAAGRPAITVTGADPDPPPEAGVYVGTEAVLHRVATADVVAFLDFDREILAPRYRAGEQAMALLARAARLIGPRARGGRIVVQTFLPDHHVIRAAQLADPGRLAEHEARSRRMLGLPPYPSVGGGGRRRERRIRRQPPWPGGRRERRALRRQGG